jgi:hypothetical protein
MGQACFIGYRLLLVDVVIVIVVCCVWDKGDGRWLLGCGGSPSATGTYHTVRQRFCGGRWLDG